MSDGRDFFCIFVIVFSFPAKIRHTRGASKLIGSFQLVSVLNSHIRSHINNLSLGKQKLEAPLLETKPLNVSNGGSAA